MPPRLHHPSELLPLLKAVLVPVGFAFQEYLPGELVRCPEQPYVRDVRLHEYGLGISIAFQARMENSPTVLSPPLTWVGPSVDKMWALKIMIEAAHTLMSEVFWGTM
jgi:hypothetical protein